MRETRSWIFLGLGLLLAALTGLALYGVAQQGAPSQQPTATRAIEVVVAKVDIPVRTVITAELITHKSFPQELVPSGAITRDIDAIGQTTVAPVSRGQTIVLAQLTALEGKHGASITIEKGLVLVAFPTVDPLTTAGLVNVGDRIDLLATVLTGTGTDVKMSQTTVQNLEVVDVLVPTKDQPQRATSLVFAVDHQVALILKYLRDAQATVDVVVRSRAEPDVVKTTAVDLKYLTQTYGFSR